MTTNLNRRFTRTNGVFSLVAMAALAALAANEAYAHKVGIFASLKGKTITGELFASDSNPVKGARVVATTKDGEQLSETRTGAEGTFTLPVGRICDHILSFDLGDEHTGRWVFSAQELQDAQADGREVPASEQNARLKDGPTREELSRDLEALRKQLAEYKKALAQERSQIHPRDIASGLGYVAALIGAALYWASLRKRNE